MSETDHIRSLCKGGAWGRRCRCGAPLPRPAAGASHYERSARGRQSYDLVKHAVDWFGTHLICPRPACLRAGRCADDDRRELPFCFHLYRGEIRYALALLQARTGLQGRPLDEGAQVRPHVGPTILGALAGAGAPIDALRRSADWDGGEWTWERDPDAVALRAEIKAGRTG